MDRRGDYTYCVDIYLGSGTESDPQIAVAGIRGDDDVQQSWITVDDRSAGQ